MQRKTIRIVLLILTAVWLFTIYWFSAKPAAESKMQSGGIVDWLIQIFVTDYDSLPKEQQTSITESLSTVVRKGAHMAEYAVLSIILYALLSKWNLIECRWKRVMAVWSGTVVFAVSDELHQIFVPGRSGEVTDVLIDGTGALIGIAIAVTVACILEKRRDRKEML